MSTRCNSGVWIRGVSAIQGSGLERCRLDAIQGSGLEGCLQFRGLD